MTEHLTLVTGATGSLGSNLTRRLVETGERVVVLKRHGESLGDLTQLGADFEVRFGDVRNIESVRRAMRGVNRVFHLAGVAVPLDSLRGLMWEVNVHGASNVVAAALEAKVERLVHTSSVAAIGYPPDDVVASEEFDPADSVWQTAYSETKRAGETAVLAFARLGLDVVVVNPAGVVATGGDRRFGWAAVVEHARAGHVKVVPGGGTALCTAHDMVEGHIAAMKKGRSGERYILSSHNVSYAELANLVAEVVGVPPPRARVPDWALEVAGSFNRSVARFRRDPLASSVLVPENVALMKRTLFYDQATAVRELALPQTPLVDAIAEVHRWCLEGERSRNDVVA